MLINIFFGLVSMTIALNITHVSSTQAPSSDPLLLAAKIEDSLYILPTGRKRTKAIVENTRDNTRTN